MDKGWIATVEELLASGWRAGPCYACGQVVVTDDLIILDRDPTDVGDIVIRSGGGKAEATSVIREDVLGRVPLWRSHLYTCPARYRQDRWHDSGYY